MFHAIFRLPALRSPSAFRLLALSCVLAGFGSSSLGCTWIGAPAESPGDEPDGAQRCDTVTDCDQPADNRVLMECVRGEGQSDDSPKVCAPRMQEVRCDFPSYEQSELDSNDDIPWVERVYAEAVNAGSSRYTCDDDSAGEIGCKTDSGSCNDGTAAKGWCVDTQGDKELIPLTSDADLKYGQDVRDQYCRWYFCRDDVVCGATGSCVKCDPDKRVIGEDGEYIAENVGKGGCQEIYINGDASDAYLPKDECNSDGEIGPDDAKKEENTVGVPSN